MKYTCGVCFGSYQSQEDLKTHQANRNHQCVDEWFTSKSKHKRRRTHRYDDASSASVLLPTPQILPEINILPEIDILPEIISTLPEINTITPLQPESTAFHPQSESTSPHSPASLPPPPLPLPLLASLESQPHVSSLESLVSQSHVVPLPPSLPLPGVSRPIPAVHEHTPLTTAAPPLVLLSPHQKRLTDELSELLRGDRKRAAVNFEAHGPICFDMFSNRWWISIVSQW